jgi:hypothetical protein
MAKKKAKKKVTKKAKTTSVVKSTTNSNTKAKTITKEIAQQFLKDSSCVDLRTFTKLDEKAAQVLSKSDGWLPLNGLMHLTEADAEGLAEFKGSSLELNGLTEISDTVARCLAKVKSSLNLNGLTSLPVGLARIMAAHPSWLELNGVKSLSDEAACLLSKRKTGRLELRGVKSLSDAGVKCLASCKDDLELGVTALSDAGAEQFASFAHRLNLPNLRNLSDAAAKSLEKLDREGRLEVNEALCKTMKQLKDLCYSWHGRLQYRAWKLVAKKVKWKDVPDKPCKVLQNAFAYGVDHDKVKITRVSLTAPESGQRHEYFVGDFDSSDMDIGWTYVVNDTVVVAEDERD